MEENKYNYDSVKELLAWAQKVLDNKSYPQGRFQISKCAVALDCGKYLSSMISIISKNWENPTFRPTIDQLYHFRELIERGE